jgi:hypothetical protein
MVGDGTREEVLKQKNQVMKWKKVECEIIRQILQVTNHRGLHRTKYCCCKRIYTLYAHGAATHGRRYLRNNYASRLRSGENWEVLYAASGSKVPRRGYSQRSIPFYYCIPLFRWLFLSVPSPQ